MTSSAFESLTFWTGIAAVGLTAAGALFGCLSWWFSSKVNSLKEEMSFQEETNAGAIPHLQRAADWTGKTTVGLTAAGALFGCLSWWFSSTVNEMKEEGRMRFETEYAAKMKTAESEVIKARQETAKALGDAAAANERTGKLEVEAAAIRERAARAEYMIKAAEVQSEEAKAEAARAGEGTAMALAETAAAKERTSKLELEAAGLRERAARAEIELVKVQERIKPRRITETQRTRLLEVLKPIPKGELDITCLMGDEEGRMFATQIRDTLKEAGWADVHLRIAIFDKSMSGLKLRFRDRTTIPVFGLMLAEALDSVGIPLSLSINSQVAEGAIEFIVGSKPDSP